MDIQKEIVNRMCLRSRLLTTIICSSFVIASCFSQHVPKRIKRKITNRLTHTSSNISDVLSIFGFYRIDYTHKMYTGEIDTTSEKIFFFEDGSYRMSYATNPKVLDTSMYLCGACCGTYRIKSDTIIAQMIFANFAKWGNLRWDVHEYWYKILDKETLLFIYANGEFIPSDITYPSKFTPSKDIPSSDCWLKKQDWIWEK